ncbi:hypothetical protein MSG28_002912 [Choristoneura fumiferana]|uniref:Uncharacterized protein n=1 Tax=Choristoneura fumiferana TaxID=7141 RepID=A0ACC0JKL8_CHOFU|nr:hypothetical protein MSG28_002912 [Choristoneura fumiferana]
MSVSSVVEVEASQHNFDDDEILSHTSGVFESQPKISSGLVNHDNDEDEGFTTVARKRPRTPNSKMSMMEVVEGVEVYLTAQAALPKQLALAKLLRAEAIGGILKMKYKGSLKVLLVFDCKENAQKLIDCKKMAELGYSNAEGVRKSTSNTSSRSLCCVSNLVKLISDPIVKMQTGLHLDSKCRGRLTIMEYISPENIPLNSTRILCCQCAVPIEANPSNMCVACLRAHVDISEGVPKQATLFFCRGCERYLQPPAEWVVAAIESRELLALCLKRLKGLNRVKLIDAGFAWTEPHSKRIKVKLTVQGEVMGGAVLQQTFIVEFNIQHQMCDTCHRTEAQDYWRALVQVRQRANNRKTFYYLEQLILKHKAHENTLGIKPKHDGLDFFYTTESHARKMVDFIQSVLPVKSQHSKKLISHDIHSNVYNYKFTYSIEIVPVSKDSVVCLPKKLTQQLGGISPICLVHRVTSTIHLIDANTGQVCDISSTVYWRNPFNTICNPKQLVKYIIMDIDILKEHEKKSFPGQGMVSNKHVLADVWVVKESELGLDVSPIHTKTHLGHILKPGDTALGYNLGDSNVNDTNLDKLDRSVVPDVFLVKKYFGERSARRRARNWKLKHMAEELHEGLSSTNEQNINIFKKEDVVPVDTDEIDPTLPRITLAEMLDDLNIEDVEMSETLDCLVCRSAFAALFDGVANGQSNEQLTESITVLCVSLNIESPAVCRGAVELNMPILTHIVKTTPEANPRTFCGLVLQAAGDPNICVIHDPRFEWQVDLPEPTTVETIPPSSAAPLTVALVTDAHLDPLYEPFGAAECGEPTCCRKGQTVSLAFTTRPNIDESIYEQTVLKTNDEVLIDLGVAPKIREMRSSSQTRFMPARNVAPAGYWGDYRNCDSPIWAFDDVVDRIAETHTNVDIVYYIGDTIDHFVWETTYELINDMNRYVVDKIRKSFGDDVLVVPALADKWDFYLPEGARATLLERGEYSVWLVYDPLDAKKHLNWLVEELYKAELAGERVHIVTHIPPGVSDLVLTWTREYNRIINRFASTITGEFNGHTHSDEFKIFYSPEGTPIRVAWGAGSATSYTNYNLNYKIATFDAATYEPINIVNYVYNLTEANLTPNRRPHWFQLYDIKQRYNLRDLSPASMDDLMPPTNDKPLTIALISDAHIDPLYEPYGAAECDQHVCCRRGQNLTLDTPKYRFRANIDELVYEETIVRTDDGIKIDLSVAPKLREMRRLAQRRFKRAKDPEPAGFAPANVTGENLNSTWLYKAWADKWDFYLPDAAMTSVLERGEYSVLAKPGLRVITWLVYDPLDAKKHLQWLVEELHQAELAGEKVHIVTHIPSGLSDLTLTWTREYNRIINR